MLRGNNYESLPNADVSASLDELAIDDTTQSTSTGTGALTVAGGVGIAKNLHVGGIATLGGVDYPSSRGGTGQVLEVDSNGDLQYANNTGSENSIIMVGGYGTNNIAISTDGGLTFVNQTDSPMTDGVRAICTDGKGTWVIGGAGTYSLAYSTNAGHSWIGTDALSVFSTKVDDICYSPQLKRWVAVGTGTNHIGYSNDAVNWIGVGTTLNNGGWGVCWNGVDRFVAVSLASGSNNIGYSSDGINWTYTSATGLCREVCYLPDKGRFVRVGDSGVSYSDNNGETWSANVAASTISPVYTVAYNGDGLLVVGGSAGSGVVLAYSTDHGDTFTACSNTGGLTSYVIGLTYDENSERWIATGSGTDSIAYSNDADTWIGLGKSTISSFGYGAASTLLPVQPKGNKVKGFDKIHLGEITVGIGNAAGDMTQWADQSFDWQIGGTDGINGTTKMELDSTNGLTLTDGKITTTATNMQFGGTAITSGNSNVLILGGDNITTSSNNIAIGIDALDGTSANSGSNNVAIGSSALTDTSHSGSFNVGIGSSAGVNIDSGGSSTCIGAYSGGAIGSQSNCTAVGRSAFPVGGSTGANNTCLGAYADITDTADNSTSIGYGATTDTSDTISLGNADVTNVSPNVSATCSLGTPTTPFDRLILTPTTVGNLPTASANTGAIMYCSNETGGATLVFSDGTNWRRVQDRAVAA